MSYTATLELVLVATIGFLCLAGLLVSAITPLVLRWSVSSEPASRHRALSTVGLAPVVLPGAALVAIMLPSVWAAYDHCLIHHGHAHLCWVHPAQNVQGSLGWLLISVFLTTAAAIAASAIAEIFRARRLVAGLFASARHDLSAKAWIVPSEEAICFSAGLLRARVFVSSGLARTASPEELEVVLAHEHAHVRRRDSLVRLLLRLSTRAMLPGVRRALLAALDLAAEQACDEAAAEEVGDRLSVAEALLSMERRMSARDSTGYSLAFGESSVPDRIAAMLAPPRRTSASGWVIAAVASSIFVILLGFDFVHHATESILAFVLR